MKWQIFLVCLFYCLFRLAIYESIAAIFWQSASYVFFLALMLAMFALIKVPELLYNDHFLFFCSVNPNRCYGIERRLCSGNLRGCWFLVFVLLRLTFRLINCSQTKFLAIMLVLLIFFMRFFAWPIFHLTHLTFRHQDEIIRWRPAGIKCS